MMAARSMIAPHSGSFGPCESEPNTRPLESTRAHDFLSTHLATLLCNDEQADTYAPRHFTCVKPSFFALLNEMILRPDAVGFAAFPITPVFAIWTFWGSKTKSA